MNQVKRFLSLAAIVLSPTHLLVAHHSFAAEYRGTPITLNATIVRFEWMNPHTRIYLNVTDARGTVTPWNAKGTRPVVSSVTGGTGNR